MRHRVATLFRANSSPYDLHMKELDIRNRTLDNTLASKCAILSPSEQNIPCPEEYSVKMQDAHKWISISGLHCSKYCCYKPSQAVASLDMEMESPPLVLYGPTATSTGALLSGQLILQIHHRDLAIDSLNMCLGMEITRKRPLRTHCSECGKTRNELENWKFLHGSSILPKGKHKFPFSWILPGHLPASTRGSLFNIDYNLHVILNVKGGETVTLSRNLDVKRAIIPSEAPRNSIRIFPPTNLTASCKLPSVLHPFGTSTVSLTIHGCAREITESKKLRLWKLKRLHWYLNETQKMYSPGCRKHITKRSTKDDESRWISQSNVRVIGEDCYRMGWKSDYATSPGRIEMEFPCGIKLGVRPICDMKSEDGTEVSHSLVVQMIFIEENLSINGIPIEKISTETARVLRMHFNMIVTERSGLGISWDEEQPPLYENVPPSPPEYGNTPTHVEEIITSYNGLIRIDALGSGPEPGINLRNITTRSTRKISKLKA